MKSHRALTLSAWLMLALISHGVAAFAQIGSATLSGRVTDQGGLAIQGAKLEAVNVGTNTSYPTTTNEAGLYNFPSLLPGSYRVSVVKEGFQTIIQSGINLHVADSVAMNFTLTVGSVTQSVTVASEASLVDTTTGGSLGGLVNEDKMASLPVNGRNYVDLTLIQPGVTEDHTFRFEGGEAGKSFSSNGATPYSNNFTIDGAMMTNSRAGSSAGAGGTTLGMDGIKEFRVITTGVDAEYGLVMGSQIVMVSKGGTNQFHGDAFEYLRNSIFDARNYFDYPLPGQPRLPHLARNDYGGSFGGPIQKDKTFFYGVYEGLRQLQGISTVDTVPGAGCHGPAGAVIWNGSGAAPAAAINATQPCTQLGVNPAGAGTNSVTIWPTIVPLLALYPNPNLTNNQFIFTSTDPTFVSYGQIRVDHNFSASDTIFGRYTISDEYYSSTDVQTAAGNPAYPQFRVAYSGRDQFLTLAENHIFSSTLLNVARVSVSRTELFANNQYPDGVFSGPQYSFVAGLPTGTLTIGSISGNMGPPNNRPSINNQTIFTFSDDLFLTKDKHSLKFGMLFNRIYEASNSAGKDLGELMFSSLPNFLRGLPSGYDALTPGSLIEGSGVNATVGRYFGFNTLGFYGQDDWRLTPRLILNLGLRYEFRTNVVELNGQANAIRNIVTDATGTLGSVVRDPTYNNISPRVGFAYDPRGKGTSVIRGFFGIYYDTGSNLADIIGQDIAPPLESISTVSNPGIPITLPFTFSPANRGNTLQAQEYSPQTPHALEYNLTAEQQLPFGMGLSLSYVGERGINLWSSGEGNPTIPTSITNGVPFWGPNITACLSIVPTCRRNPNFASDNTELSIGNSWYNGMQMSLIKRLSQGLEFQNAFTWSQALDDTENETQDGGSGAPGTSCGVVVDPGNRKFSKGPACFDATLNDRINVLYHFPTTKAEGIVSKLVNGWWIGNIVSLESGYPFTPILSTNRSRSGVLTTNGDYVSVNTAASIAATFPSTCTSLPGQPAAGSNPCLYTPVPFNHSTVTTGTVKQWYNPAMFSLGPVGYLGTAGRDMLRGPGLREWDFSIVKDTALRFPTEGSSLQFRAEFFNILNTANFGLPNGTTFTGSTGDTGPYSELPSTVGPTIASTITTSRQIQFALKLIF